ncbi:hypothetical protein FF38_02934 [Lucilia cuprina]|uniref:Uncharacterized protein n=1 Tax=Lucilia cuprina TaxID=7375 RepID=A0A0L0BT23_LUCCU|nr:hypothetical protein FF38_02934 [Lucilia cuprina]
MTYIVDIVGMFDRFHYDFQRLLSVKSHKYPTNCLNRVEAKRAFLISNEPHSVETPCNAKSNEYSLINVVLPLPVGPVIIVNSPLRCPLSSLLSMGNRFHLTPFTFSIFCNSLRTSFLRELKVVIDLCRTGVALCKILLIFKRFLCASKGQGSATVGRMRRQRFSSILLANVLATSQPVESHLNHNTNSLKCSKAGKDSCGRLFKPYGKQTIASEKILNIKNLFKFIQKEIFTCINTLRY